MRTDSLLRVCKILKLLKEEELSTNELARRLGLHHKTAHRLLTELYKEGKVKKRFSGRCNRECFWKVE